MPFLYYEPQLRIIEDQILILLRRTEFPHPWAIGTVKTLDSLGIHICFQLWALASLLWEKS